MKRAWLIGGLMAAASLTLAVFNLASFLGRGVPLAEAALPTVLVAYVLVGALIVVRRPDNSIGWLFLGASLGSLVGGALLNLEPMIVAPEWRGAAVALALVGGSLLNTSFAVLVTFLILLFPTGRAPSPRWRPVLWLTAVAIVLLQSQVFLEPRLPSGNPNPLESWARDSVLSAFANAANAPIFLSLPILAVAGLAARYRRAGAIERLQLRWFLLVACLMAAALVVSATVPAAEGITNVVGQLSFALLPVAVGIAILRHQLFDIDVVINRTVVYAALTATLGSIYVASVIVLQGLLSRFAGGESLAVAASTLAVAALFQPVRHWIQAAVDRRFFRSRYDAARLLGALSSRLRDEVDQRRLLDEVTSVIEKALQPASTSIWLRKA